MKLENILTWAKGGFGLAPFDMIVIISNVILFIFIQTAFFMKVGSSSFVNTLVSKLEPVKKVISYNEDAKAQLDEYITSPEWIQEKATIKKDAAEQESKAYSYLIKNLSPLLAICGVALGFFIMKFKNSPITWNHKIHTPILAGVLLAYSSEFLTFFLVMNKWEHISSLRLLKDVTV